MRLIQLSSDVVPIGEFKSQAASYLERLRSTGHPIVITQNGKPAGVLLSPAEFDKLQYKEALLESIDKGVADLDAGKSMDTEELERRLQASRKNRMKKD